MAADGAPSFLWLPELPAVGGMLAIAGDEAHYLARVVRVRAGETFGASDGAGAVATLEALEVGERVRARVVAREQHARASALEVWCGAPEGDRADWLVEKLGELGVAALVPLQCRRARWERAEARRERWERLASAALRQSRSPWRLELRPPLALEAALAGLPAEVARWVCRPDGAPAGTAPLRARALAVGVVGPASGFTDDELKRLEDNGFRGVALARTRLRTETAALALAAVWAATGGDVAGG